MKTLRAARVGRHWTLRRLVEAVDTHAGRATGLTESLVSQWEHGNVKPSMRYRGLLAQVFAPEEIDFEGVDGQASRAPTLLTSHAQIVGTLNRIVAGAETSLALSGSRSREASYLEEVEQALVDRPALVLYRVLFGPPRTQVFKDHLLRLLEVCDPMDRTVAGVQRLYVAMAPEGFPEANFCCSEKEAMVVLPSLTSAGAFDTGLGLPGPEHGRALVAHVQQLYHAGRKLETRASIEELPIEEPPLSAL